MASSPLRLVSLTDIQQLEISGQDAFENDAVPVLQCASRRLATRISRPKR
jgi:hypothetical protein